MLQRVLGADPTCAEARRELRRLHEDMGRWEMAVALEMLRLNRREVQERRTLAALLTQQGKAAWAEGQPRHGAAHLQSALAFDPDCTEAALYLGRILLRQGKMSRAFHIWEVLAKARPEFLFLAFRDMQAAFRQARNDAGWENFLHAFTQQHPSDPAGYLALAECHDARGQAEEARRCLQQALELDPVCREAHLGLLALYRRQGAATGEVLDTYERLVQQTLQRSGSRFRCRSCGHTREEPFWRCPTCYLWATPERLMPSSSAMQVTAGEIVPSPSPATIGAPAPLVMAREASLQPRPGA
jgi:lipopolysaccharide biosynthesis regulator YciM